MVCLLSSFISWCFFSFLKRTRHGLSAAFHRIPKLFQEYVRRHAVRAGNPALNRTAQRVIEEIERE